MQPVPAGPAEQAPFREGAVILCSVTGPLTSFLGNMAFAGGQRLEALPGELLIVSREKKMNHERKKTATLLRNQGV